MIYLKIIYNKNSTNNTMCDDSDEANDVFGCGNLGNELSPGQNCGPRWVKNNRWSYFEVVAARGTRVRIPGSLSAIGCVTQAILGSPEHSSIVFGPAIFTPES